jgi:hypothetical protein
MESFIIEAASTPFFMFKNTIYLSYLPWIRIDESNYLRQKI